MAYRLGEMSNFRPAHFCELHLARPNSPVANLEVAAGQSIGLSPNATELEGTYVSNPEGLIKSAYTNLDPNVLQANNVRRSIQVGRLEETKSTIARMIFKNLQTVGDEEAFFRAVRTSQVQGARGWRFAALLKVQDGRAGWWVRATSVGSMLVWFAEEVLLRVIGAVNGWGASIARPIAISLICFLSFAVLYAFACAPTIQVSSIKRSYDIAILAGYTNYGLEQDFLTKVLQAIQVALSSLLYAITFATIIARISRVR